MNRGGWEPKVFTFPCIQDDIKKKKKAIFFIFIFLFSFGRHFICFPLHLNTRIETEWQRGLGFCEYVLLREHQTSVTIELLVLWLPMPVLSALWWSDQYPWSPSWLGSCLIEASRSLILSVSLLLEFFMPWALSLIDGAGRGWYPTPVPLL